MFRRHCGSDSPKRTVSLTVRHDLLIAAREVGIDLSVTLERALTEELAESRRNKWRNDNREAISAYNEHVKRHGTFSNDVQSF